MGPLLSRQRKAVLFEHGDDLIAKAIHAGENSPGHAVVTDRAFGAPDSSSVMSRSMQA